MLGAGTHCWLACSVRASQPQVTETHCPERRTWEEAYAEVTGWGFWPIRTRDVRFLVCPSGLYAVKRQGCMYRLYFDKAVGDHRASHKRYTSHSAPLLPSRAKCWPYPVFFFFKLELVKMQTFPHPCFFLPSFHPPYICNLVKTPIFMYPYLPLSASFCWAFIFVPKGLHQAKASSFPKGGRKPQPDGCQGNRKCTLWTTKKRPFLAAYSLCNVEAQT